MEKNVSYQILIDPEKHGVHIGLPTELTAVPEWAKDNFEKFKDIHNKNTEIQSNRTKYSKAQLISLIKEHLRQIPKENSIDEFNEVFDEVRKEVFQ